MKKVFSPSINSIIRKAVYLFFLYSTLSFAQGTYTVSYLIVAGGGGGGAVHGGGIAGSGGGAGGLIAASTTVSSGNYSITVGAGGAGGTSSTSYDGSAGGNSSAFGITAYGGGAGIFEANGGSGGSGGGGAYTGSGGSDVSGQGYPGGNGSTSDDGGAGGGGAGGAGQSVSSSYNGGNGGVGYLWTTNSTYYAGGGGGGGYASTPGTGGNGGGGAGGPNTGGGSGTGGNGVNGTANTGGGGGGGTTGNVSTWTGGNGGSGVVILVFPTGSINYTTSGSASTSGGNTLITFNSTGTFSISPNPPTITLSPTSAAICIGSTTSLTASGAVSYTWSPTTGLDNPNAATVNANPSTTTTYTVSGTNVNGCVGTNTITVTVNPLPSLSISPSTPVVQGGQGATIVASGASTYTWSPATNLSATTGATVTATPQITTHYTLTGTSSAGCVNSMKFSVGIELWQQTADTANAPIYYGGKVGIGNNNPQMPLDITGNARVSGNLYVGGGFIESSNVSVINALNADSINAISGVVNFADTVKMHKPLKALSNMDAKSISFDGIPTFSLSSVSTPSVNGTGSANQLNLLTSTSVGGTLNVTSLAAPTGGYQPLYADSLGNLRVSPVHPCIGCTTAVVPLCNTGNPAWLIGGNTISPISNAVIGTCDNNPFIMETYGIERMRITAAGNVYVGIQYPRNTPYNNALFTVNGQLVAKEMYVEVADWADYVFKKDYKLMPLSEVEKYYKANQHLPEVPSEKDVKEKGMNVSEMNSVLLKKIEELTLYTVELEKKLKAVEEKVNKTK